MVSLFNHGWRAFVEGQSGRRHQIVAVITSNMRLAEAPGNVRLPRRSSKLRKESVVNVSQLVTVDRSVLTQRVAELSAATMHKVDDGIRLALGL